MKGITICQPYAHMIATGAKFVENRNWYCRYTGWLAIHAGKSRQWLGLGDTARYPDMAFGAFVAVAYMAACVDVNAIDEAIRRYPQLAWLTSHEHALGPHCFVLTRVYPLTSPIEHRGERGLFNVPGQLVQQMRKRYSPTCLRPEQVAAAQQEFPRG